jgi:hypothetical protein
MITFVRTANAAPGKEADAITFNQQIVKLIKDRLGVEVLGRDRLRVDVAVRRRGLLDNGYSELTVTGEHAGCALDPAPYSQGPL